MAQSSGLADGPDGIARCAWALSAPDYLAYHDDEWGRPVHDDDLMFERLTLEGFQSGLSWLIVLRKRTGFRAAFAGFRIEDVAAFGDREVDRLLQDPGIIRNRAKIAATVANARVALDLPDGLAAFVWQFAPDPPPPQPRSRDDVAATTNESRAMSAALRRHGMRFVGPTTAYALMQATGMVNDHIVGCAAG